MIQVLNTIYQIFWITPFISISSPLWISIKEKLNPIKMILKNLLTLIIKRSKIRSTSRSYRFIDYEFRGMKFRN
jgi:hypothetical protein